MSEVPSSPGTPPLDLQACFEEIVRFTLLLAVQHDPECEGLGLSEEFISGLLKEDDDENTDFHSNDSSFPYTPETGELGLGVPTYPLYKQFAKALYSCVVSQSLPAALESVNWIQEDEDLSFRLDEWKRVIIEVGSNIVNMLNKANFELHVQEPFFSQLRGGLKTIEGRCAVGQYKEILPGSLLLFNKCLLLEVQDVKFYGSFAEMLTKEGTAKFLPNVQTIEEGVRIYRQFYTEEKEKSNGVVGLSVLKPSPQPNIYMSRIVSDLGFKGVGSLLGLKYTNGSVVDGLPPIRSNLISSFMLPYKPKVESTSLTVGARALAKHVSRCRDCWWGDLGGNDYDKNRHALDIVSNLVNQACWINIHALKPYDKVFEIRVKKGYGARWCENGTKFVGFLEPYMEDGHSVRWRR